MKLCRFLIDNKELFGVVKGDSVYPIKEPNVFGDITVLQKGYTLNEVKLLCPTLPKTVFAVGLNYKNHAKEMDMQLPDKPLIFIKGISSIIANGENIIRPIQTKELSCEAELAIVVKKKCKNISVEAAAEYILGYSMINDVTARDIQREESQWTRAKSFDTFCPYGPIIETDIQSVGPLIRLYIDSKVTQNSVLSDMIFNPLQILSYVSKQCTLNQGDIIATGTPSGVSTVYPGQKVVVEIDNLGRLENTVIQGDENND